MLSKKINHALLFAFILGFTTIAMSNTAVAQERETYTTSALSLKGTVTDSETGEPISGVEIELVELAMTATTDEEGKFEISDIQEGGIYTVRVDHEGYELYEETHEVTEKTGMEEMEEQTEEEGMGEQKSPNEIEIELTPSMNK